MHSSFPDITHHHKSAQRTLLHPGVSIADPCGGFNTLCIIAKGIKSDCNHLMRTKPLMLCVGGGGISFQRNDILCFLLCYFLNDFFSDSYKSIYSNNDSVPIICDVCRKANSSVNEAALLWLPKLYLLYFYIRTILP